MITAPALALLASLALPLLARGATLHHVQISTPSPTEAVRWYERHLDCQPVESRPDAAVCDGLELAFAAQTTLGSTQGTAHLAFEVPDLDGVVRQLGAAGVELQAGPSVPANARTGARRAVVLGPDSVTVALVEPGFAGTEQPVVAGGAASEPPDGYKAPRTPCGEPDLQGVWTANAAHGIPLERPQELVDVEALTPEQAEARRERGTLGSIWGYEREWRDTTLGYDKMTPSTQVAMIFDPPDGRLPPLTSTGERLAQEAQVRRRRLASRPPAGPEDLSPYVRCITRGLPGMMMPGIYNNGLQIVQGPGFVALQKEMIHETRVVPTQPRERVGSKLRPWLGDPLGRWEGDSLVVETQRFNGESMFNILSGARARDREAEEAGK